MKLQQLKETSSVKLQQCLPLAVLKLMQLTRMNTAKNKLQQCLPLAVLKRHGHDMNLHSSSSCNSAYRLRYWNSLEIIYDTNALRSCNSAYRLRYWNIILSIVILTLPTSCNSAYRLRYWNAHCSIWVRNDEPLVATVLTACGIETHHFTSELSVINGLQQCLPLAVLKLGCYIRSKYGLLNAVATVLTACGIETF